MRRANEISVQEEKEFVAERELNENDINAVTPFDLKEIDRKVKQVVEEGRNNIRVVLRRDDGPLRLPKDDDCENFLILCHVNAQYANYYSVLSFFTKDFPVLKLYDFCGRKYLSFITKREKICSNIFVKI